MCDGVSEWWCECVLVWVSDGVSVCWCECVLVWVSDGVSVCWCEWVMVWMSDVWWVWVSVGLLVNRECMTLHDRNIMIVLFIARLRKQKWISFLQEIPYQNNGEVMSFISQGKHTAPSCRVWIAPTTAIYHHSLTPYQNNGEVMSLITNKTSWLSQSGNTIVSGYHFYDLGY